MCRPRVSYSLFLILLLATTSVANAAKADLAVLAVREGRDPVLVGEVFDYFIDVRNNGPANALAGLIFNFPSNLSFLGSQHANCSPLGSELRCALGNLNAGESRTVRLIVLARSAGLTINSVTILSTQTDPKSGNNFGSVTTLLVSSAANTFYVSPSGSDANSCSSTLPCRQIRRALALVGPGDTILVADGTYKGFDVRDLEGLAGSPITIKAQGTNAIIQKTTDRPDNRDTIFITFSSNIVVDGLRSFNANRAAIRVDQSPNVTIRNCVLGSNGTWGIFTDFSDDLLIENNETYGSVAEHGIYVSNSGDRPVVRGNRSHDNRGAGIHMNADVTSGGDGIITGALIEKNVIYNNGTGGGAGINMDGVQNSIVRNNVLYNNHATGIALYQIDGAEGPKGNKVLHNTVHQATDGRWALLVWRAWGSNRLRNNVLYHPNPARGGINFLSSADVVSTDSDYNVLDRITPDDATVYTLAQWKLQGHEPHSLSATPTSLFVNAMGGDYHLAASSPAIDRGRTLAGVTGDRDGNQRPLGAASDIGAYEAGGVSPSLIVSPTSLSFGSVNVGSGKNLTVTVKNVGGGILTGSASTSPPFKVVGPASYSLAANQTAVLTVRFSAANAGARSRTLTLTGGGGGSVYLSGTGVSVAAAVLVPASPFLESVQVGSVEDPTVTVETPVTNRASAGTLSSLLQASVLSEDLPQPIVRKGVDRPAVATGHRLRRG